MQDDKTNTAVIDKIEAARSAKAKELYLSDLHLTEIPDWLKKLTWLRELDLSGNHLKALPEWLGDFKQLKSLNLSYNNLTILPETLGRLRELRTLGLSSNKLMELPESLSQLVQLQSLDLSYNRITALPEWLGQIKQLTTLLLFNNQLQILPEQIGQLELLTYLSIGGNQLKDLPISLANLKVLKNIFLGVGSKDGIGGPHGNPFGQLPTVLRSIRSLTLIRANNCGLKFLPAWVGEIQDLQKLFIENNKITDLPSSLSLLNNLNDLDLTDNPLNSELSQAYKQGVRGVKAYLRAKAKAQTTLNEAKLILVGEGEVGKTCLMDALLGKEWQEHPSTHGIEIQQVKVVDPDTKKEITLNGWDFGGQRVYRPTHQLFFSAPAIYLVVWKPREGPQQGFVKEWIQIIKRREPTAKILVVATHGGPQQRQPDIDRQELWDLFGKETVNDFFLIESKPDENGKRKGIEKLRVAIARIATELPEVGRSVPKSFQDVRRALQARNVPYLPLSEVMAICYEYQMDDEIADLFIKISHRLGHLTHYENDPTLRDIVILRPDWLATAMSYVLDDEETRRSHGLVRFSRLSQLWTDPDRPIETRYPDKLHRIFLRLMERFDLSYRVADPTAKNDADPLSLIGQLVPDNRPVNIASAWLSTSPAGDIQQMQVCRIVDKQTGQSATAEGLFYQLIVRLHKYSLGRVNYTESVHWQRGLVLDNAYNGRALLEHKGNDIHITVRAPYPERFLAMLTEEVKYLVESFWEGLRCDITVPCLNTVPCVGLLEVRKLIESAQKNRHEYPCPICNEWQDIETLLRNAPAATRLVSDDRLYAEFIKVKDEIYSIRPKLEQQHGEVLDRFTGISSNIQKLFSQAEDNLNIILEALADEAKEAPRLFSLVPIERAGFDPRNWVNIPFCLTLWCEHSHLPLPVLNQDNEIGVYRFDLSREWIKDAAPLIKAFTVTLKSLLPLAFATAKLAIDAAIYKEIENELDFSKACIDALVSEAEGIGPSFMEGTIGDDAIRLPLENVTSAQNAILREFHALINKVDPSRKYGNLVKVTNKQQKFLWVHEKFATKY